jgi:hypothetical protein
MILDLLPREAVSAARSVMYLTSLTHSLTHTLTHSLTHSLTLTHTLTHTLYMYILHLLSLFLILLVEILLQICLPGTSPVVCFDESDLECQSKTGNGDYDYVLFDQIWLPEFCHSLDNGFDPTLTHLEGSHCQQRHLDIPLSKLSIHGMWPNYVNGYPQCCDIEDGGTTTALSPQEVVSWPIWTALQEHWPDVTEPIGNPCSVCLMVSMKIYIQPHHVVLFIITFYYYLCGILTSM